MNDSAAADDLRVIAIDWSGRKSGAERTTWLAEVRGGELVRLENGRTREELVAHLMTLRADRWPTVVGLDFAFSMPAWFVREQRARSAGQFWQIVAEQGERWLERCEPPFWGRAGTRKYRPDIECLRATDIECASRGYGLPKSVFQIAGAGAVGTGSLRGIPWLRALHDAGYAIWPFCPRTSHTIVEIYPRVFTGPVVKRDYPTRNAYLAEHFAAIPSDTRALAASTEDAFDAAVSALRMWEHRGELVSLPSATSGDGLLEGAIWLPAAADRNAESDA